ncbi:MAG: hypothetical protein JXM73_11780 [Anaerolineae bacterium]|nr:hypothetical protein [Anaerolineae bacterium]
MDLKTVLEVLEGKVFSPSLRLSPGADLDLYKLEFSCGGAADLMSDVLAFARPDSLLLTGLTHPQVVRTAEMAGILALVFVRGKHPPSETAALAAEVGIPLLGTRYKMYEACGRLYAAGLPGTGFPDLYALPHGMGK